MKVLTQSPTCSLAKKQRQRREAERISQADQNIEGTGTTQIQDQAAVINTPTAENNRFAPLQDIEDIDQDIIAPEVATSTPPPTCISTTASIVTLTATS